MRKIAIYLVTIAVSLAAILYVLGSITPTFNFLKPKPIRIADTPILISEAKAISELFSVCYYDEIVIDSTITEATGIDNTLGYIGIRSSTTRQLVYIVSGRVYAGFDLSKMNSNSLIVQDSVITIKLGQPEILDVVVNPSDFSTFIERGRWNFDEATSLKMRARDRIKQRAIENGILENCVEVGAKSLKSFYSSLGFKEVIIDFESKTY